MVILAPYQNNTNQVKSFNIKTDFDIQGNGLVWYAHPQLFFNCTLARQAPRGAAVRTRRLPIKLAPGSFMQRAGVPMLYDSASNPRLPCLYICPVTNVLGRAPLIPCFVGGNSHPTIPNSFKDDQRLGSASADTQRDLCNGSRLYEVNIWTWRYGRGRPRMVSIAEAERIRSEPVSESRIRAAETRKLRSEQAGSGAASGSAE